MAIARPSELSPLRLARLEAKLSLEALHHETGVGLSKLSAAERGLAELTPAERRAVAAALGLDPSQLFGDEDRQ